MNRICKILDCFYGPQQLTDCPSDGWRAIKVYRDGNEHEIGGPFDTEEEAEACAAQVHADDLRDNSQFGVGA
jgi:hypothetical protein